MKYYTGYFPYVKKYEENNLGVISIARFSPKWYQGYQEPILAPNQDLLRRYKNGEVDEQHYKVEYLEQLNKDKDRIKFLMNSYLSAFDTYDGIIFVCYEKSEAFCHRHIFAEWLQYEMSIEIKEYDMKGGK